MAIEAVKGKNYEFRLQIATEYLHTRVFERVQPARRQGSERKKQRLATVFAVNLL